MKKIDVAVAGSGIVGMAIARGLLELDSTLRITIYEKEGDFGTHASARNSGVLHAGFYYSPESLKARYCREGREELTKVISKYDIPIMKVGKVVLSQNHEEESRLETLLQRGILNGVELERYPASELQFFEPLARTHGSFLWSPHTSISDPLLVNLALRQELQASGVQFISNSRVDVNNRVWTVNDEIMNARYLINAGGAWALDLAQRVGSGLNYRTMPFLGMYRQTSISNLPIRTLIYPVPHPINPFLGVHFTLTMDGHVKIGPSALPVIGKSQYQLTARVTRSEIQTFGKNLVSLGKGSKHDLYEMMKYEIPKLSTLNLVRASSKLVPSAMKVKAWTRKRPGIRGQLIDSRSGELVQDFLVEHSENSTHILNAVSPGWTAGIPFGRSIAQSVLEHLSKTS